MIRARSVTTALGPVCLAVSFIVTAAGPVELFPNPVYRFGSGPFDIALADFDEDGHPDVAAALSGDEVAVLLGRGGATFGGTLTFPAGDFPRAIVVADFDDDTLFDLAVANFNSDDVSVFLGLGDGTFAPRAVIPVGDGPRALTVADFDGDGSADLAVANSNSGTVILLQGDGSGGFAVGTSIPGGFRPSALTSGDFNNDGAVDVAVAASFADGLSVHLGRGDGTFETGFGLDVSSPTDVLAADFDGDGNLDIAASRESAPDGLSGQVLVFRGDGDGAFAQPVASRTRGFPQTLTIGELNGDGVPDLVSAGLISLTDPVLIAPHVELSSLIGNGDGSFTLTARRAPGLGLWSLHTADLDQDGTEDLLVANAASGDLLVLPGAGDGSFDTEPRLPLGSGWRDVRIRDLDGDGTRDIVTANEFTDEVAVLLGTGAGTFGEPSRFAVGDRPFDVAIADVDGDGRWDVVTANENTDDVSVLLGNGDGTFDDQVRFPTGNSPRSLIVADLDGDGWPDVATANFFSGDVSVLRGLGNGAFAAQISFIAGTTPNSISGGDFDGNGIPDLAVAIFGLSQDEVAVFLGLGGGAFADAVRYRTGARPYKVVVSDVNEDGRDDVLTTNFDSHDVSVLLGIGDGTFDAQVRFPTSFQPRDVQVDDFDGDGRPDLAVLNFEASTVSILTGNGDGTFDPDVRFGVGQAPEGLASGDLNEDDRPDLVVANRVGDGLSVLLNLGSDNLAPSADAGPQTVVECTGNGAAESLLDGSGSSDPDSTPGTNDDIVLFEWFEDFGTSSATLLGLGEVLPVVLPLGEHTITLRVTDGSGATDTDQTIHTVADTVPPEISLGVTPQSLWPPNHRLVDVSVAVSANDVCDTTDVSLVSVTSSEPDDEPGGGDGRTTGDIADADVGAADFSVKLRAERSGNGSGRAYDLTYVAVDGSQNSTTSRATVDVPHAVGGLTEPLLILAFETSAGTRLAWTDVEGARSYTVIRASLADLSPGDVVIDLGHAHCIEGLSADTTTYGNEDSQVPPPGVVWIYLVEFDSGTPSGYGTESAPLPRVITSGGCR